VIKGKLRSPIMIKKHAIFLMIASSVKLPKTIPIRNMPNPIKYNP
jgi:hypothetical protein